MRHTSPRISAFAVVLAGMCGVSLCCAAVTRAWLAMPARRLLAVRFATIPATTQEALTIWLHNSRLVVGVAVCVSVSALVRLMSRAAPRSRWAPLLVADAILVVWASGVAATAGVLLGAYGAAQARAFWPYAPVEVCAWALLLAVYATARLGRRSWLRAIRGLLAVEGLLAIAALLEVFGGRL